MSLARAAHACVQVSSHVAAGATGRSEKRDRMPKHHLDNHERLEAVPPLAQQRAPAADRRLISASVHPAERVVGVPRAPHARRVAVLPVHMRRLATHAFGPLYTLEQRLACLSDAALKLLSLRARARHGFEARRQRQRKGCEGSGNNDLSTKSKTYLEEKQNYYEGSYHN